jgi:hypothetical protein
MNLPREPDFNPTDETERIQFLMSRQLDGDLTQEETAELALAQRTGSESSFFVACTALRRALRTLPVQSIDGAFRNAIQSEISSVSVSSMPHRQRGWIARSIVAVSVASCIAALLLMSRTREAGPAASRVAGIFERSAAKTMPADISVADAAGEAEPPALTASADSEDLRPFLENNDWRIVVVKVHSKDRKEVMRDIEALVAKNGMDMRSVAGNNDHDPRFGILFTSSGVDDRAFVENVLPQTDTQSADWDAQSVAESTRESIIRRVQESMKIPTHSEIHFGQVYVTLPKFANVPAADVAAADQRLPAENSAIADAVSPSSSAEKLNERPGRAVSNPSALKLPVLVVFEFASDVIDRI